MDSHPSGETGFLWRPPPKQVQCQIRSWTINGNGKLTECFWFPKRTATMHNNASRALAIEKTSLAARSMTSMPSSAAESFCPAAISAFLWRFQLLETRPSLSRTTRGSMAKRGGSCTCITCIWISQLSQKIFVAKNEVSKDRCFSAAVNIQFFHFSSNKLLQELEKLSWPTALPGMRQIFTPYHRFRYTI